MVYRFATPKDEHQEKVFLFQKKKALWRICGNGKQKLTNAVGEKLEKLPLLKLFYLAQTDRSSLEIN